MFNPALLQALKLDSEAAARAKGEIVGIDFDPFVGGQDADDHYEARRVTWEGTRWLSRDLARFSDRQAG